MGAVFEAVQEPIGRRVAVKVLHAKYAQEPQITARFFNEARAVNLVDHPGIVQVSDYGQLPDGTAYLVMEFLKGETLNQRQKQKGRLPLPEIVRLGRQIASALAAAHDKGVFHRDLKPDNIMLVPDPDSEIPGRERAKLLDFGIAKVSQVPEPGQDPGQPGVQPKTSTDVVMGTPRYMAPEQCRGGVQIDDKADVYSLGIMLYELLAGRAPFLGGSGEVLAMHIYETPTPLREVAPHVPEELAALVHKLIAKKKDDRPAMREVVTLLEQLSTSYPTAMLQAISLPMLQGMALTPPGSSPVLTPVGGVGAASRPVVISGEVVAPNRRKRLMALIVVGAIGLCAGTLAVVLLRHPDPGPPPALAGPPAATPAGKAKQVHWSLTTVPPGALVVRAADEQVLGITPWVSDRPVGDGLLDVKLRAPGYNERLIKLNLAGDELREEMLDPVAPKTKPVVRPPVRPPVHPTGRPAGRPAGGNSKKNDNDAPRIVD
jgi:tRNA A-37 threonylcarbamoyl transferase component Bud32